MLALYLSLWRVDFRCERSRKHKKQTTQIETQPITNHKHNSVLLAFEAAAAVKQKQNLYIQHTHRFRSQTSM